MITRRLAFYEGQVVEHVVVRATVDSGLAARFRAESGDAACATASTTLQVAFMERITEQLGRTGGGQLDMMLVLARRFSISEHRALREAAPVAVIRAEIRRCRTPEVEQYANDTPTPLSLTAYRTVDTLEVEFLNQLGDSLPEADQKKVHRLVINSHLPRFELKDGIYPRDSLGGLPFWLIHAAGGGPKGFKLTGRIQTLDGMATVNWMTTEREAAFYLLTFAINCNETQSIAEALAHFREAEAVFMKCTIERPFISMSAQDEETATSGTPTTVRLEFSDKQDTNSVKIGSPQVTEASVKRVVSPESVRRLRIDRQAR